jgi:hypothetical protein
MKAQRFLCDEMLLRLAKWLRAAGYDTTVAESGLKKRDLLQGAIFEGRKLLTRNRKFMEIKGSEHVVFLLNSNDMHDWVEALSRQLEVDWCLHPFSRCLICNNELLPGQGPCADILPGYVMEEHIAVFHCPACNKAYWHGGHVQRMRRQLEQWNR